MRSASPTRRRGGCSPDPQRTDGPGLHRALSPDEVEADSAYIGGQLREVRAGEASRCRTPNRGPATKERAVIFAAVERGGRMRATLIGRSRAQRERRTRSARHARVRAARLDGLHGRLGRLQRRRATGQLQHPPDPPLAARLRRRRRAHATPSRASSATSRPTCAARTTRSRRAGSPAT